LRKKNKIRPDKSSDKAREAVMNINPDNNQVQIEPENEGERRARIMSGSVDRPRVTREEALHRNILAAVEEKPGMTQPELARQLNEKAILVLSCIDQMVNRGQLTRLERGEIYPPGYASESQENEEEEYELLCKSQTLQAEHTLFWARTVMMFYQMVRKVEGISLDIDGQWLRIFYMQKKLIAVRRYVRESLCEVSIYGNFKETAAKDSLRGLGLANLRISPAGNLVTFKCRGIDEVMGARPQLVRLVEFVGHQRYLKSQST
jgi:Winged helix-turn-helix DNA-binding